MTARTVPVSVTENPGTYITSAWQNAQVKALTDYLTGVPIFFGYQATSQSLATATFTALTLDSESLDTDGGHSTTTNTSRYVFQVAGKYRVDGTVVFTSNSTSYRAVKLVVNGATNGVLGSERIVNAVNGFDTTVATSGNIVTAAVGDYVELYGYQNSGGPLATHTNTPMEYVTCMSIFWLST